MGDNSDDEPNDDRWRNGIRINVLRGPAIRRSSAGRDEVGPWRVTAQAPHFVHWILPKGGMHAFEDAVPANGLREITRHRGARAARRAVSDQVTAGEQR